MKHQLLTRTVAVFSAIILVITTANGVRAWSVAVVDGQSGGAEKLAASVNADVVAARKATADKHYDEAESLMLKVTGDHPELLVPRMELGLAQIGLKKYPEAEKTFEIALGIDPASTKIAHSDDFYDPNTPETTRASRNTAGGSTISPQNRTPEIKGVAYCSLGEIYIRTNRIPQAVAAFDSAAAANPSQAALYRRNETIFFFQTGHSDEPLKAAEEGITLDPTRASLYYFKGQALVGKATLDSQTQKMVLPPGCAEAYQKYLELEPNGQFSADAKGVLTAAGLQPKSEAKAGKH